MGNFAGAVSDTDMELDALGDKFKTTEDVDADLWPQENLGNNRPHENVDNNLTLKRPDVSAFDHPEFAFLDLNTTGLDLE